jgi:hypothetical protein
MTSPTAAPGIAATSSAAVGSVSVRPAPFGSRTMMPPSSCAAVSTSLASGVDGRRRRQRIALDHVDARLQQRPCRCSRDSPRRRRTRRCGGSRPSARCRRACWCCPSKSCRRRPRLRAGLRERPDADARADERGRGRNRLQRDGEKPTDEHADAAGHAASGCDEIDVLSGLNVVGCHCVMSPRRFRGPPWPCFLTP